MGSLMAGWACNIPDPKVLKYKRNTSLTKEEINAYWRSQKKKEEEHPRDSSMLSPRSPNQANSTFEETAKKEYETSNSGEILGINSDTNWEKLIEKHGWWVISSLAHLNETPVLAPEEATYKRASRFNAAPNMIAPNTKQAQTG
ncbi:uncharacterized protein [Nicotiana tomentosiformis]|uniref:uncharacterized protein n=1 Tax=Nicotiana tomentosiformis TaxID=4098 RepID=UPI00051C5E88|nr:uncharacterized protein LOC104102229 [Nicotiana tomentosiformis]